MESPVRCAIYTRVSTDEQAREGYSLPAQEERLRSHAKSQGWAVYKLYVDDGYSAASRKRPALQQLLADAAQRRFDVVLAYKIDRLSRSLKDLIDIVAELNEHDVGFKSCTELIDTTRPEGRLMFHQFGSFAQYERELISQRTKFGMMKRLQQGLWNGIPPYGYRIADGKLIINRKEAKLVKQIFDWYVRRNMGVVAISRELNDHGVSPRKGARWKGNTIHRMLRNPLYTGMVRWAGEVAQGCHRPIISQEVYDLAQAAMKARYGKGRQLRSPHYLAGLVTCGLCGAPMHVTYPGASGKRKYRYYVCTNRLNHRSCQQDYVRADILEHSVLAEIAKLSDQQEVVAKLVDQYVAANRSQLPPLEQRKRELTEQLAELRTERDNTSRWLGGNGLTTQAVSFINSQVDVLADRETAIQEERWQIEDQINALAVDNLNAATICHALADWVTRVRTTDAGERKLLVEAVVQQVRIDTNNGVAVTLRPPSAPLNLLSPSLAPRGVEPLFEE